MKRLVIAISCLLFVAVVQAQTECETMLEAANNYYAKGDYTKAAKMYGKIQEDCGANYGGSALKLKDCNHKLKEDEDFNKCNSITACNEYLKNYPDGRYVVQVQQKRAEIIKANTNVAEDDEAYRNCITKEDYLEYLKKHPYGRHLGQARAMVAQFEEDEVYENCTTEQDCDAYLKTYPNGRYYSEVLEMKNAFEEERLRVEREAARTAYMHIREIDFANTHSSGTFFSAYGATLYVSDVQYLTPRISYDAILDETRWVTIYYKIFRPDGTLMYNSESPSGYTVSNIFKVQTGSNNIYELPAWGNDSRGYYVAGTYRFELWFEGSRVYQTLFVIEDRENALSRGKWRAALRKCCDYVSNSSDNGSSYKGQYYNYRRSGLGLFSWKNISYYIGNWDSGDRNGMGMKIMPSGCSMSNCPECEYFVGEFSSDAISGAGSCYDKYGNLIYMGNFANDRPTQNYPMSGYDSYKFECIEYGSGDCYVGETYYGKPHGKGLYISNNGDLWYGDWKYGNRDGYGALIQYQGSVSTGTWENGTQQ